MLPFSNATHLPSVSERELKARRSQLHGVLCVTATKSVACWLRCQLLAKLHTCLDMRALGSLSILSSCFSAVCTASLTFFKAACTASSGLCPSVDYAHRIPNLSCLISAGLQMHKAAIHIPDGLADFLRCWLCMHQSVAFCLVCNHDCQAEAFSCKSAISSTGL